MLIKRPAAKVPATFTIERPLFVVSAPCAGTSPIFELLARARRVCTLNNATRNELRTRLEADDITTEQLRALVREGLQGPGRWLSAIVANARQIPLLNEAFPDALFIHVHRNAPEQLARMELDGHSESDWSETTSRIMKDLAALPARRWCAVDIDGFLANRPHEAALLGRFAEISWRVRPGPARKAGRRAPATKTAIVLPELAKEAAAFAQANHASLRDLPEKKFWKSLPENVAKAVVSGRLAAGLAIGAAALPGAANAATLTVTNNSDTGVSGDGSLRGEILAASAGDTIAFDPSLNGQTITLTGGTLSIKVPLTIQGPGSSQLTIDGGGTATDAGLTGGARIFYLYAQTPGVDGGAATPADVTISGLTLKHGDTSESGGAILTENTNVTLSDVTIEENRAAREGGGLYVTKGNTLTIQNSLITGNAAGFSGGGLVLYQVQGSALLDQLQVTDNTSKRRGGGIYLYNNVGDTTIQNSTIAGNASGANGGGRVEHGGGVFVRSSVAAVLNSTISGNTSSGAGGGIQFYGGGNGVIENSTITGNTAGRGGGVSLYTSSLIMAETTVSGNTAIVIGGGLYSWDNSTLLATNSIIAGNDTTDGGTTPNDTASDTTSPVQSSYSLIQVPGTATFTDGDGGFSDAGGEVLGEGNIVGQDPLLGALADNGGPTETMLPGTGSPVINTGDPDFPGDWPAVLSDGGIDAPTTDQRGDTRVVGGRIDMGAVEVQPPDAGPTPVTDAGSTVQTSDAGPTKTATGKGCNCNGSGDAALALLTPLGLLLMRRRRNPSRRCAR